MTEEGWDDIKFKERRAKVFAFDHEFHNYLEEYKKEASLDSKSSSLLDNLICYLCSEVTKYEDITGGMVSAKFHKYYYDPENFGLHISKPKKQFAYTSARNIFEHLIDLYDLDLNKPFGFLNKKTINTI